jgi:hypothetical protein
VAGLNAARVTEHVAEGGAKLYTAGYAGVVIGGMSLPDWAAALAIATSLCLLIQYAYKLVGWVRARRARAG